MYPFVKKHGIILSKSENIFENEGVFNPAAIREGEFVHLFYRAVSEGNFSTLGYCKLKGPTEVIERYTEPVMSPGNNHESHGIEDPRITKIEGTYYLTYSAYDGVNVSGSYATSQDLKKFERHGTITPRFTYDEYSLLIRQNLGDISDKHLMFYDLFEKYKLSKLLNTTLYVWDKNLVFFPRKIHGKFAFLHRLYPSIQISYYEDPKELTEEYWSDYISNLKKHIVLTPSFSYERGHIGAGCPPIETDDGWLLIYHAAQATKTGVIYHAAAALLDIDNPCKVLAHLKKPLFEPSLPEEEEGVVNNVVFPTGSVLFDKELYIYYGAADLRVAVASMNINTLLNELKNEMK